MTKETLQPSDLRIGNWVNSNRVPVMIATINCTHDKPYLQFYAVNDIRRHSSFLGGISDHISGISLTPEILEKWCGVEKDGFGDYNLEVHRYDKHFRLLRFSGDYLYLIEGYDYNKPNEWDYITLWNKDRMKEYYLHQLQNLYYCLTGIEMEVKMP